MEEGAIVPVPNDIKRGVRYATDLIVVLDLDETLYRVPHNKEELDEFRRQGIEQQTKGVDNGILRVVRKQRALPVKLRPGVLKFLKTTALTRRYEMHIFTVGSIDGIANSAVDALSEAVICDVDFKENDFTSSNLSAGRWFLKDCDEDVDGRGVWFYKPLKKVVRASKTTSGHGPDEKDDDDDDDYLLKRVVIVDNRSDSHCFNKSNGIPVRSFRGANSDSNDDDKTFKKLSELLRTLEDVDDVRPVLEEMFEEKERKYL